MLFVCLQLQHYQARLHMALPYHSFRDRHDAAPCIISSIVVQQVKPFVESSKMEASGLIESLA